MVYPIVKYGDPVLEKPCVAITKFDDELLKLADDMFESMYAAHGVGLAAPQIGISKRVAVIDVTFKEDPEAKIVLVNPEIIHVEGRNLRSNRLGTPCARPAARNRPPKRKALHQSHQRPQARHHEAQDSQADENRRMVKTIHH